jgi:hypothetical protein
MAINMPHEGGLKLLNVFFAGTAAETVGFDIHLYVSTTTFVDTDTATTESSKLVNPSDWAGNLTSLAGYEPTLANLAATGVIQVPASTGVPQIQFPEFIADFATVPTGITNIYGYAIFGNTSVFIIARELFIEPWVVAADKVLRFVPVIKIGNTTGVLT